MSHVAMLLSNPFRPDPRVLKEARSLAQAGYEVTIICWDRQGELAPREQIEGFEIRRFAIRSGYAVGSRQVLYLPRFWRQALRELAVLEPDIVHCHDLDTAPAAYCYARKHHIPWVFDAHECYPEHMGQQVNRAIYYVLLWLEKFITRRATHVITVGELLAQYFRSLGGKASVVGNYYPLQSPRSQFDISRADLNLCPDEYIVAYIGGFTSGRAILELIRATKIFEEAIALLVGDGHRRATIEAEIAIHPNAHYVGWVPQEQVSAYTALADVIYYAHESHSLNDGNIQFSAPNALFNAMVAGKPIITTNTGETRRIVAKEQCGVIIDTATPEQVARAMEKLCDPDVRSEMGGNARRAAETQYNWGQAQTVLLDVYRQLEETR